PLPGTRAAGFHHLRIYYARRCERCRRARAPVDRSGEAGALQVQSDPLQPLPAVRPAAFSCGTHPPVFPAADRCGAGGDGTQDARRRYRRRLRPVGGGSPRPDAHHRTPARPGQDRHTQKGAWMSETSLDGLRRQDSAQGQETLSLGDALKALRETRGLSLPEVSARIKYSAVQLGHLEAGDWARLPDGVPLRGLVRNYARFLETDIDAALRMLDHEVGSTRPRPAVSSLNARRALQQADMSTKGEPAHRTWAWLLLLLVLFCVVGIYAVNRGW